MMINHENRQESGLSQPVDSSVKRYRLGEVSFAIFPDEGEGEGADEGDINAPRLKESLKRAVTSAANTIADLVPAAPRRHRSAPPGMGGGTGWVLQGANIGQSSC